ncbi:MAG: ATP-binding protein [Sediminibacterium sp.]|nr:ATP-binding protein [Sediminibacterium sp.]
MNFRISSGLKDLIGNELITDNNIAVFELVKNSFDAGAKKVTIRFENIYDPNARITIIDDGKGMDYDDLENKWLFVAYSAKRDGTEEDNEDDDYRNRIKLRKFYAGAKGVGRFSCDRLGEYLNLITKKNKPNAKIENLIVNWKDFEEDQTKEFIDIDVKHKHLKGIEYNIQHGTILEISNLRNKEEWNRDAFIILKEKLSKLIRPQIGKDQRDSIFKIILEVKDEKKNDQDYIEKCKKTGDKPEYRKVINGEIKNFIFEHLDLKTTKIISEIDDEGATITTTLIDREKDVYSLTEKNPFSTLQNISTELYFLNRAAKKTFTQKMGIEPVNYGNVFVYKNGFRIHPYGDPRNDMFGIDTRALQSYSRFLGTRNLIGQIDIIGDAASLKETTSRDGGLIRNQSFNDLIKFFFDKVLRRLEKYVVEVTDWGVDDDDLKELNDKNVRGRLVKHIANITKDDTILNITYNSDIIKIVEDTEQGSAKSLIKNFKRIASETKNERLLKDAVKLEKKFEGYRALDKENVRLKEEKDIVKSELEIEKQKNVYLSVRKPLSEDAEKLIHSINFNLVEIDEKVIELIDKIKKNHLPKNALLKELSELKFFTEKSRKISEIATRANYKYEAEQQWIDIPTYLKEYLSVYNDIKKTEDKSSKAVEILINDNGAKLKKYISPIEIAILADNLISNAIKWRDDAKKTSIRVDIRNINPDKIEILFSDNGKGVLSKFLKMPGKIFELGVTETKGSGIGLNSAKRTLEEIGGKIDFVGNNVTKFKGACFKIIISK